MHRYRLPLLFSLLFLIPQTTEAVPAFTVSPLVIDVEAEARDILDYEITVTNTGSMPLTIYPMVNNISLDDGGTIEEFLPPSMSDRTASLAAWLEIKRAGIELPRNESITLPLILRVNPTPVPGEYHAFVGFGFGRNRDDAERMVKTGRGGGTVVTVNIKDDTYEFLKLSRFVIDRFITSSENQAAVYTVNNPGDKPLVPTGEIIFYNNRGKEVAMMTVNPDGETIQPGEQKEFNTEVPVSGLFGKYKAHLSVEYGSELASVQDTAFFYVFPIRIILIILGVVSVIAVIAALYVHRRYLDDEAYDDSEPLPLNVRTEQSDSKGHEINLKENKNE